MPKLMEITTALRKDQALQVWFMLETDNKMTLAKACQTVGITPDVYRRWIIESGEALEQFRQAQSSTQRMALAKVLIAQEHILDRLIKDAVAPFTDPGIRLQIYQYLVSYTDDLIERTRETKEEELDFLRGPTQKLAESRFSASEVEITIRTKAPPQIIDITPKDTE